MAKREIIGAQHSQYSVMKKKSAKYCKTPIQRKEDLETAFSGHCSIARGLRKTTFTGNLVDARH